VDVLVVAGDPPMSKTTAIGSILARRRDPGVAQLGAPAGEVSRASQASASERPSGSATPSSARPRSLAKLDLPEP
jgi:hypothetical protein